MESITLRKKKLSSFMMILVMTATFFFTAAINTTSVYAAGTSLNDLNITVDEKGLNTGIQESTSGNVMTDIITKYKTIVIGISGIALVTMILVFIMNFAKLGTVSGNPTERAKVISALVFSAIATAGLGSLMIWVGFFYNMFK